MSNDKKGLWANIGGAPVDLNAGMIEAVTNPPPGFVSRRQFLLLSPHRTAWPYVPVVGGRPGRSAGVLAEADS